MHETTYLKIILCLIYAKFWLTVFQNWIFFYKYFLCSFILDNILLYIQKN